MKQTLFFQVPGISKKKFLRKRENLLKEVESLLLIDLINLYIITLTAKSRVNCMHKNKFLFIDWISPEDHNGFNQAFFDAINVKNSSVVFFNKKCRLSNQNIKYIDKPQQGRFARMLSVYMLAIKSKKPIFFLKKEVFCFY